MDEFYYRLIARYPKFPLPAMPRKTLFVGESDIRERRVAFDDLMKAIAKHPTLATCSEVMEFLGKAQPCSTIANTIIIPFSQRRRRRTHRCS